MRQFFYLNFSLKSRFHKFFYDVFKIVLTLREKAGFSDQRQTPEVFYNKVVHKNFAIFAGKHLCWSLFLIKLQAFRPATSLKRNSDTEVLLLIL